MTRLAGRQECAISVALSGVTHIGAPRELVRVEVVLHERLGSGGARWVGKGKE